MSFIEVENITKNFRVVQKKSGLKESFKSLFKREYKTIEAYHEMAVVMAKNFNVKTYKKITFKLEER